MELKNLKKETIDSITKADLLHEEGVISDGHHTFDELYKHRVSLYLAFLSLLDREKYDVWYSQYHDDGSQFEGWLIVCAQFKDGSNQISYHIPMNRECDLKMIGIPKLPKSLKWDGHTSDDVETRLASYMRCNLK